MTTAMRAEPSNSSEAILKPSRGHGKVCADPLSWAALLYVSVSYFSFEQQTATSSGREKPRCNQKHGTSPLT